MHAACEMEYAIANGIYTISQMAYNAKGFSLHCLFNTPCFNKLFHAKKPLRVLIRPDLDKLPKTSFKHLFSMLP